MMRSKPRCSNRAMSSTMSAMPRSAWPRIRLRRAPSDVAQVSTSASDFAMVQSRKRAVTASSEPSQTWLTREPADRLRPFIDRYVSYRLVGFPPGVHRGLPSRHMTFIASIGPPIDVVAQTGPGHLFGMPARELWDRSLEFSDVVGSAGSELWERLQDASEWDERFRTCDEILLRLAGDAGVAPELRHSWTTLVQSKGQLSVSDLAAEVGYSRQHLGQRFRDEFGLSPKLAARIVRFESARRMLQSVPSYVSIAQVASACGYYDQAHLYRDFAELAGCTPRELLGEELPSFQDDLTGGDA